MNRDEFIQSIQRDWAAWQALLLRLSPQQLTSIEVDGWTIQDTIAHVTWYEREMVGLLQSRELAGSEWWGLPNPERNELIHQQNQGRSLDDVLDESTRVHRQLMELLAELSQAELENPQAFAGMPEDWSPWQLIAENTCEHYRDHTRSLVQAGLD